MNSKSKRPADQDQLPPVEWVIASHPVDYPDAVEAMSTHVEKIAAGDAAERIWLVEHPPLITAGTSAKPADLLLPDALPVYHSGRGGQYTYHGPGQRIAYVMLDLTRRQRDVRKLVQNLEGWIIDTLASFNVDAYTVPNRVGVWTSRPDKGIGREDKIAAIGIRLRKWVSFHGISLNVAPDLHLYDAIVPCGIADQGVTSLEDLGQIISMSEVDMALRAAFENRFGATI